MTSVRQDTVTDHWNFRANSYNSNIDRDFFKNKAHVRWQALLAEAIDSSRPLKVLDAGCGPAVLTRLLLSLGHEVTAADVSENMIMIAKKAVSQSGGRVSFHQGDVAELPFEDNQFDLIISRYVVWTLPDPIKAIMDWKRMIKPGGRISIIDGNWYYHYYRSGLKRTWSHCSNILHWIKNNFDPGQKLASHYAGDLPSTHLLRPYWDQGVLAGLGFEEVKVYKNIEQRIWGKWSTKRLRDPWNHQFLIMGTKP